MWGDVQAEALSAVFSALNDREIRWMVLRNYEGLPWQNRSKDVDLVLAKSSFAEARRIISEVLRIKGFTRNKVLEYQYVCCLTFFCLKGDETNSIKIDLLDGFAWRGAQLFESSALYAKRRRYFNFAIPDVVSDGFMLWAKPLMTGGFVKDKYIADIKNVISSNPAEFHELLVGKFGSRLSAQIWPLLQNGDLGATVDYKRQLCRRAWWIVFLDRPIETGRETIFHFLSEIRRRSRRPAGSFVAVVGPDGVGKTTFISEFRKELSNVMVIEESQVVVQHFRPGLFPNIKKLISIRSYDESQEEFTNPHRTAPAGQFSSMIRITYYWLDYFLGYWFSWRSKCVAGQVCIYDRYFYDFIVDPQRSRVNLPDWVRDLFLRITPQPDVVFFLDCDSTTVYARKQELSRKEIERQLGAYRKLTLANPRFYVLNADKVPEILAKDAVSQLILRCYKAV